jgi:hypothetical protein
VILNKQGASNPLQPVQPWDMLLILGHGLMEMSTTTTLKLGSDPQPLLHNQGATPVQDLAQGWWRGKGSDGQGLLSATYIDVANWLEGKLKDKHVLIKLSMCSGAADIGGDDRFAKNLAGALFNLGYEHVAVGGFTVDIQQGTEGTSPRLSPGKTEAILGKDRNERNITAPAKNYLRWYHGEFGNSNEVSRKAIGIVKELLREFARLCALPNKKLVEGPWTAQVRKSVQDAQASCGDDVKYVGKVANMLHQKMKEHLKVQPTPVAGPIGQQAARPLNTQSKQVIPTQQDSWWDSF